MTPSSSRHRWCQIRTVRGKEFLLMLGWKWWISLTAPYGLGAGKVFTPWSSKYPTDIFVLQPLELVLRSEVEELQAANDLLKQQMASMQRLYDVTAARGSASCSAGSTAANCLQAGGNLGFCWVSVLGVFFSIVVWPSLQVFVHAFTCQDHCATTACCAHCRATATG